jgi:hypothetical protein
VEKVVVESKTFSEKRMDVLKDTKVVQLRKLIRETGSGF